MARIVVTEFMDEAAIAQAFDPAEVLYDAALVDAPQRLYAALADAEGLIVRNRTQVNPALLAHAPRLKAVGRLGVGLDNIDLDACKTRGIAVFPASGANDLSVAEYVITAALMLLRGAWLRSAEVAAGQWPRNAMMGRELSGKTLGLVGYGAIARETAARARGLGMSVIAFDPHLAASHPAWTDAESGALEQVLARADVVSLHVPLTSETRRMIDASALSRMKPGAILINAARGGVVDEAALAGALRAGALAGAALDVFETEPLTSEAGKVFEGVPNLLLTPHIAGVTEESNVRVSAVTAQAVARALHR